MNPSEQNKNVLLEKYVRGTISSEEMHLLNQLALDDDFLFDALEGLSTNESSNASAIDDLKSRLNKTGKKKIPFMYWIAAAASLIIIVISVNFISNTADQAMDATIVMEEMPKEDSEEIFVESVVLESSEIGSGVTENESVIVENESSAPAIPTPKSSLPNKRENDSEISLTKSKEAKPDVINSESEPVEVNFNGSTEEVDEELIASDAAPTPTPSPPPKISALKEQTKTSENTPEPTFQAEEGAGFSRKKRSVTGVDLAEDKFAGNLIVNKISKSDENEFVELKEYISLLNYINSSINLEKRTSPASRGNAMIIELNFNRRNKITSSTILKGIDTGIDQQILMLLKNFDQWDKYKDEINGKIKLKFDFGS